MTSFLSTQYLHDLIIVVSGLPRSGTSMMMRILGACKIPLLVDDIRKPDEDNPRGYYEFERVKDLESDNSWLDTAHGKAVKIVSPLLQYLNVGREFRYKIIFMLRSLDEILASQKKMANRLKYAEDDIEDNLLKRNYLRHLEEVKKWLEKQKNIDVLYLNYSDVVNDPASTVESIVNFLGIKLDTQEIAEVIDASLYRQRTGGANDQDATLTSEEKENQEIIMDRLRHLGYI
jgi:hypothetical protein